MSGRVASGRVDKRSSAREGLGEEGVEGVVAAAEWPCHTASGRKVVKASPLRWSCRTACGRSVLQGKHGSVVESQKRSTVQDYTFHGEQRHPLLATVSLSSGHTSGGVLFAHSVYHAPHRIGICDKWTARGPGCARQNLCELVRDKFDQRSGQVLLFICGAGRRSGGAVAAQRRRSGGAVASFYYWSRGSPIQ